MYTYLRVDLIKAMSDGLYDEGWRERDWQDYSHNNHPFRRLLVQLEPDVDELADLWDDVWVSLERKAGTF